MNILRLFLLAILLSGIFLNGSAQTRQTEQAEQFWLGYLNQTRLTYNMNDDLKFYSGV